MTPQELREAVFNFRTSRIILTGLELELFTALGKESKTSAEVAGIISADTRATDRLMNTLCNMDLLEKKNGQYSNTDFSSQYLVKGKPDYISNLLHSVNLWDSWSGLTEVVRKGKPPARPNEGRKNWLVNFIEAMHYRASKQAPGDISLIDLSGVRNVLDLGGGSGAYAMEFVKSVKEINATVFDLPDVIPLTEKYLKAAGLVERIKTIKGNYLSDGIGSGYDAVFLSAVIHSNSFDENKALIKKCADSLNKNGQVIIQDYVMDEDRISPPMGAMFAINMLVNTQSGDTFTQSEIYSWLKSAGLKEINRKETSHGAAQVAARKI